MLIKHLCIHQATEITFLENFNRIPLQPYNLILSFVLLYTAEHTQVIVEIILKRQEYL